MHRVKHYIERDSYTKQAYFPPYSKIQEYAFSPDLVHFPQTEGTRDASWLCSHDTVSKV